MGSPPRFVRCSRPADQSLLVEQNGDVFSCDHFVFPAYKLGNLAATLFRRNGTSPFQSSSLARLKQTFLTLPEL